MQATLKGLSQLCVYIHVKQRERAQEFGGGGWEGLEKGKGMEENDVIIF